MKIAIAGTGYVGLVTGVCLAEKGHNIICVDTDAQKVALMEKGVSPIYETGLEDLMEKNKERLAYTVDWQRAYKDVDVIFIAVGTPERRDGSANLNFLWDVIRNRNDCL